MSEAQAEKFRDACYAMNTKSDLLAALTGQADHGDCSEWGITEDEWRWACREALAELEAEQD